MTRRNFVVFVLGFFTLWTISWLVHNWLVSLGWWSTENHGMELAYWASEKFAVWVVYPWIFWRRRIPSLRDFIGLSPATLRRGYRWGMIAALIWIVSSLVLMPLRGQHFVGVGWWPTFIYTILLTPIFEEMLFRGFIVSGLQELRVEGKITNLITTVLFLLVHMLGWSFQQAFLANMTSLSWLGIVLFSLVAGFLRIHSKSLRAPILLHIVNNVLAGIGLG